LSTCKISSTNGWWVLKRAVSSCLCFVFKNLFHFLAVIHACPRYFQDW
jgi:hypothetical protein